MTTYDYFEVPKKGPSRDIIDQFFKDRIERQNRQQAIKEKYGAREVYFNTGTGALVALGFPGYDTAATQFNEPPAGFRKPRREDYNPGPGTFYPLFNKREGRARQKEFYDARIPTANDLTNRLGGSWVCVGPGLGTGFRMEFFTLNTFGDKMILNVPRTSTDEPGWKTPAADLQPMKSSTYWKLREKHDARKTPCENPAV